MGRNQNSDRPSLTGQTFGNWKVGEGNLKYDIKKKGTTTIYSCTCIECGTVQNVRYTRLVKGVSSHCFFCRSHKQFCVRGHDTHICGRTNTGICRMCARETNLMQKYGINLEEYTALYNAQGGKCAICGRKLALMKVPGKVQEEGRAELDHEHILKKQKIKPPIKDTVRGILCGGRWAGCNTKLGRVDKLEWLKAAVAYIENPPAKKLFGKGK